MKKFDHYEFTAILVPGVAVLFGLVLLLPGFLGIVSITEITLGTFGLSMVVAYILGHMIQVAGTALESIWWKIFGGMPSDWIRTKPGSLLAPEQIELLQQSGRQCLGLPRLNMKSLTAAQWHAVTRQIHAAVAGAGRAGRIETFNGNYGLNRGLAAASLLVAIAALIVTPVRYDIAVIAALVATTAACRMHRFARHYARELFTQFLQLPRTTGIKEAVPSNPE